MRLRDKDQELDVNDVSMIELQQGLAMRFDMLSSCGIGRAADHFLFFPPLSIMERSRCRNVGDRMLTLIEIID